MTDLEILNTTVTELSTKFRVLGNPIDLSLLESSNGKKKIFNLLSETARPVFENDQRILVYQPANDRYSYSENLASDSLIFLQTTLQKIDISNWFVIVISGNPNIQDELEWVRTVYSTDSNPINHHCVNINFKKNIPNLDTFCVNMWNHLHISTQLEILPCCIANNDKSMGDLSDQTLDEIINSTTAREIRLKMLSGQRCVECATCYTHEDQGLVSRRQQDNTKFKDTLNYFKSTTNIDGSLTTYRPETLDIRLNNICNLKCRTCSGVYSSQLAQEEKKVFNNVVNFQKIPSSNTRAKVLNSVIGCFDHAKSIYFAGGEPLILKEHYVILDYLIEINKTDLKIFYNTNFSNLLFKDKSILDYWKKFSNISIGASLDGHGQIFEYVRHGAKWSEIEKNLTDLQINCPHVDFTVTSTISLLSVESIIELQQMWHNSKKLHINKFQINPVIGNDFLTLQSLLPHHKKNISKKIDDHCQWLIDNDAVILANSWQQIQQTMWAEDKSYVNQEFAQVNRARDIERQENFELIYPHFYDLFSPYYTNKSL
jgi:MoaA/NifB/PqqE/SkfB family radical SAM enzyme